MCPLKPYRTSYQWASACPGSARAKIVLCGVLLVDERQLPNYNTFTIYQGKTRKQMECNVLHACP